MASLLDKIKHKINPKTADIKDSTSQTIGTYVKEIQEQAEFLAKKARKIKQMIKSDVEIKPDDTKKLAKELFANNTSGFESLTQLYISFKNISEDLGLEKTAEKFKKVEEINQKIKSVVKIENPKIDEPKNQEKTENKKNNQQTPQIPPKPDKFKKERKNSVKEIVEQMEATIPFKHTEDFLTKAKDKITRETLNRELKDEIKNINSLKFDSKLISKLSNQVKNNKKLKEHLEKQTVLISAPRYQNRRRIEYSPSKQLSSDIKDLLKKQDNFNAGNLESSILYEPEYDEAVLKFLKDNKYTVIIND